MKIETEIKINAPVQVVWNVLTDFSRHPEWNPFIKSIVGTLSPGERLKVHICPPGQSGMSFAPFVLKVDPEKEFSWKGKLLVPGLFDGEHFFLLENIGPNETRLVHGEQFSGLLVPLLKSMLSRTKMGFDLMNQALKERAESAQ
ncbi:MAG: SRPBCC family protein [Bacteriovorax sp.]